MKKMVRKMHSLSVPSHTNETEEWQKKLGEDEEDIEEESKWLFQQSSWPNRILQPSLALLYLFICWYISVDLVFGAESMNWWAMLVWGLGLLFDIGLNLNTVRLSKGKFLRARSSILMEYVKKESYLDMVMVVCMIVNLFDVGWDVELTFFVLVLFALFGKLSLKGKLIGTYFSFKKYVGLVDSVLLLLFASHINVLKRLNDRHYSCFCPQSSLLRDAGYNTSKSKTLPGVLSTFTHSTGQSLL